MVEGQNHGSMSYGNKAEITENGSILTCLQRPKWLENDCTDSIMTGIVKNKFPSHGKLAEMAE